MVKKIENHMQELKIRGYHLVFCYMFTLLLCYINSQELVYLISRPLLLQTTSVIGESSFIFTSIFEVFFTYLYLSLVLAVFFCIPICFYQIWAFLVPGFYPIEKKTISFILSSSWSLIYLAFTLGWHLILPLICNFFLTFEMHNQLESLMNIELQAKINEYIYFTLDFIVVFSLAFQLPIILYLLIWYKLISLKDLEKNRHYSIIIILSIAALISPPDIISQLSIGFPLFIIYEISIILQKLKNIYL
uniref:Sec-independent protein translocase component TatC n=1 Tax=Ancoracysta twista TaxID=2044563 RepID=A0A2H4R8I7_9EUKA|nr:Sec-independent protein translocase component TatC [Ancoracysta twista]ATY40956.1 Sec-independent protein translocase component TatC [Ancoracysta twista]